MNYEEAVIQLSRQLSAGLLADQVILLLYKHQHGIQLKRGEIQFLSMIAAGLKALAQFADISPFELALSNPIKTAAATENIVGSMIPEFDVEAFRNAQDVSDILESVSQEQVVQNTAPAFQYFEKISRNTVASTEEYIRA